MTATLEGIVRPFQTRDVSPAFVTPANGPAPQSNTILAYGKSASAKTFQTNYSSNVTYYMDQQSDETERETHVKRVYNEDDKSQYVDVEYIDKLKSKRKHDGQVVQHTYNNTDDNSSDTQSA